MKQKNEREDEADKWGLLKWEKERNQALVRCPLGLITLNAEYFILIKFFQSTTPGQIWLISKHEFFHLINYTCYTKSIFLLTAAHHVILLIALKISIYEHQSTISAWFGACL